MCIYGYVMYLYLVYVCNVYVGFAYITLFGRNFMCILCYENGIIYIIYIYTYIYIYAVLYYVTSISFVYVMLRNYVILC